MCDCGVLHLKGCDLDYHRDDCMSDDMRAFAPEASLIIAFVILVSSISKLIMVVA